jgi:hypothetical protein
MSQKHAARKNVIYEICNEPSQAGMLATENTKGITVAEHNTTWAEIKTYANTIIPIIRANDPDAVILVGTPSWSTLGISTGGDWHTIANDKLTYENIMYVFHFYAVSHTFRNDVNDAAKVLPLFCSEWATSDYQTDSQNDFVKGQAWVDMMAANKISWGYWNYAPGKDVFNLFTAATTESGPFLATGGNVSATGQKVFTWLTVPEDNWKDTLKTDTTTIDTSKSKQFTLVDDCEHSGGFNKLNGPWYTYNDVGDGGHSTVLPGKNFTYADTGAGAGGRSVHVTYTIAKGTLAYPGYIGVGCIMTSDTTKPADLTKATSISFYYKGAASRFRVETTVTPSWDYFSAAVPASAGWTRVSIAPSILTRTSGSGAINLADVKKFSWQAQGPDGAGELWIDSITIDGVNLLATPVVYRTESQSLADDIQLSASKGILNYGYSIRSSGHVAIGVYNLNGQRVMRLLDGERNAGFYSATADLRASGLPHSMYFLRIETNGMTYTRKFSLME